MADDIRNKLQQRVKAQQNYIGRNVDIPLQDNLDVLRDRMANAFSGPPKPGPDTSMDTPMTMGTDTAMLPPNAPQGLQDTRQNAMIAAAENMSRLKEKESAMRMKLDQEDAVRAQEDANFDPSSYQKVPRQETAITPPARFGGLQARMQGERGTLTDQDVNAMAPQAQAGPIELSEDPEEQQRQIAAARLGR